MMFRIATARHGFGWSPAEFWGATFAEYQMAMDGLNGRFDTAPIISRDDMAFLARAHGKRPSIRTGKS